MRARAASAQATRGRILAAAADEMWGKRTASVRLEGIADRAGVTVQTVLRLYGTRERLLRAGGALVGERIRVQREAAPPGDVDGTLRELFDHYEQIGDFVIRLLADEAELPDMAEWLAGGRRFHRRSMQRQFAPWLERRRPSERRQLVDALVAACDVYTWKLLRRDMGRSREQAEACVRRLVAALLGGG
jgi:AcrR family transcriptional regulator